MYSFFLIYLFFNLIFFFYYKPISKLYNLYDYPDNNRKLQKYPIPLLGGLFFIINLSIIFIFNLFLKFTENNLVIFFDNQIIFFLISYSFYFLGYYDDKYHIKANVKLLIMISFIFIALLLDKNLLLTDLKFTFYSSYFSLGNYSFPITILCFLFVRLCFFIFLFFMFFSFLLIFSFYHLDIHKLLKSLFISFTLINLFLLEHLLLHFELIILV